MDAKQLCKLIESRRTLTPRVKELTKEQQETLIACRHHDYPVTFPDIIKLWEEAGWGVISESILRKQLRNIESNKKLLAEILAKLQKAKK